MSIFLGVSSFARYVNVNGVKVSFDDLVSRCEEAMDGYTGGGLLDFFKRKESKKAEGHGTDNFVRTVLQARNHVQRPFPAKDFQAYLTSLNKTTVTVSEFEAYVRMYDPAVDRNTSFTTLLDHLRALVNRLPPATCNETEWRDWERRDHLDNVAIVNFFAWTQLKKHRGQLCQELVSRLWVENIDSWLPEQSLVSDPNNIDKRWSTAVSGQMDLIYRDPSISIPMSRGICHKPGIDTEHREQYQVHAPIKCILGLKAARLGIELQNGFLFNETCVPAITHALD